MAGLWQRLRDFQIEDLEAARPGREPERDPGLLLRADAPALQNVKRGVADVVTAKKRLELQTQLEKNVVKLEPRPARRSAAGREDLARQALERKAGAAAAAGPRRSRCRGFPTSRRSSSRRRSNSRPRSRPSARRRK